MKLDLTLSRLGWMTPAEDVRAQVRHNLSVGNATGRGSRAERRRWALWLARWYR